MNRQKEKNERNSANIKFLNVKKEQRKKLNGCKKN